MGLDQFAFTTTEPPPTEVDFKLPEEVSEIHYWRKHPNLHGWMQDLYFRKGGTGEFNCDPVVITAADLHELEAAIRGKDLPSTSGFFFGQTTGEELEDDLAFIEKARKSIEQGHTVIYDSWW